MLKMFAMKMRNMQQHSGSVKCRRPITNPSAEIKAGGCGPGVGPAICASRRSASQWGGKQMDDDLDYTEDDEVDEEHEFVGFVTRMLENNRGRQVRETIERIEESRKLRDLLGLDGFELGPNY